MIELRWRKTTDADIGTPVIWSSAYERSVARYPSPVILQYRQRSDDYDSLPSGVEIEWSEWTDVPLAAPS
jgi:hypothetical protein